jgi:L-rhamnose mutarotase
MPRDHPCARLRVFPGGAGPPAGCGPAEEGLIMERVCFLLRVRPDRLDEYKARHREVWPEMLDALRETGWRDYSLFLRDDGLLVGYLECDDFEASVKAMEEREVNARWQAEMTPFFELPGDERPDTGLERLEEVFHLA